MLVTKEKHCRLTASFCVQCHMKGGKPFPGQGGKRNSHIVESCFLFWGAAEQAKNVIPINCRLADVVTGGTWFSLIMSHKGRRDPTKGSYCHRRAHSVVLPVSMNCHSVHLSTRQVLTLQPCSKVLHGQDSTALNAQCCFMEHRQYCHYGILNGNFAPSYTKH